MLEAVYDTPQLTVEQDSILDGLIASGGRSTKVSQHLYRVTFQDALPGVASAVQLDNAAVNFPSPGSSDWQEGFMQPLAWTVPVGWTELAKLTSGPQLSVVNFVKKQMTDAIARVRQIRDQSLCGGDGTGFWGTITAVTAGATNYYTMSTTDFGSHLINKGQNIDTYNGTALLGTSNVQAKFEQTGSANLVYVDQIPVGTAGGSIVRFGGLTTGAPVFVYGLPYWNNNATTGLTITIDRSQPANSFIVSNGVNAAGSTLTPPLLRLGLDQVVQALGASAVKAGKFKVHMHINQRATYEQTGLSFTNFMRNDGTLPGFDLLSDGEMRAAGNIFVTNIHANLQRIDFLNLERWGKIRWGDAPWWFNSEGRTVFQQIGTNGQITAGASSFMMDTVQYFVDNPKAQAFIYALKTAVGY